MKKISIALLMLSLSINASAISWVSGKVARIYPTGNMILFNLKSDQCGRGVDSGYYYFNLDSESNKASYALILAAANTDKPIVVSLYAAETACPASGVNVQIRYLYQDF